MELKKKQSFIKEKINFRKGCKTRLLSAVISDHSEIRPLKVKATKSGLPDRGVIKQAVLTHLAEI